MPAAFKMIPAFSRHFLVSTSKSSEIVPVFRSRPTWPETYRVPSTRIPGLNGRAGAPDWLNSGGAITFFAAQEAGHKTNNDTKTKQAFRIGPTLAANRGSIQANGGSMQKAVQVLRRTAYPYCSGQL